MSAVTLSSSIDFPLDMFFSVEREQLAFAFDQSSQVHRPRPDLIKIFQRVFRVVDSQVDSFVPVFQQQFAAIFEIAVGDVNERLAEIRQTENSSFCFTLFQLRSAISYTPRSGLNWYVKKLLFVAELFGEERIDERDVVVNPACFEDLLASEAQSEVPFALRDVVVAFVVILAELAAVPAVFDVFPQLEAELVGIDLAGMQRRPCRNDDRQNR